MTKFEEMVFSTWLAENQDMIATSEMNRGPITAQLWTDDLSDILDDETWIDYLTEDDTLYNILKEYEVLN